MGFVTPTTPPGITPSESAATPLESNPSAQVSIPEVSLPPFVGPPPALEPEQPASLATVQALIEQAVRTLGDALTTLGRLS